MNHCPQQKIIDDTAVLPWAHGEPLPSVSDSACVIVYNRLFALENGAYLIAEDEQLIKI